MSGRAPLTRNGPALRPRSLARDARGVTIIEFGLIAPALCVLLLGAFDIGHTLYMKGVLEGAVQKASRDGSLESAAGVSSTDRNAIDQSVRDQILPLNRSATITFKRRFYRSFSDAVTARAEQFTDTDGDGQCDHGEPFADSNNNGVWDADGGDDITRAGARDDVVYTVTVSYPRLFPLDKLVGASGMVNLSATTILANQPFGDQSSYGPPTVGHCP